MRSYLAMELIGTFWFAGAILARTENLDRLWVACMTIAAFYYLRAILKYGLLKETANVEKDIDITVNVDADGMRSSSKCAERSIYPPGKPR